jgi:protein-histidine pros-kinase
MPPQDAGPAGADRPRWLPYAVAVGATALTLLGRELLPVLGWHAPLLVFALPVMASAWYGGLGPGLLATALGTLAGLLFLAELSEPGIFASGLLLRVGLFVLFGVLISALCGELHRVRRRVEASRQDALRAVARLEEEVKQHRQTEENLRLSEERLRLALDSTNVGLWDYHLPTEEVYFNDPWFRLLDYQPGELPMAYQTWLDLLHPDDRPGAEAAMAAALRGQLSPYSIEFRLRRKDGGWKWILSVAEVLQRDPSGRPRRMTGVHIDIDARKREEETLRQAKEAAERANQIKTDFLAHMTHELRTPLNGVTGMIDLLSQTALDERQRRYTQLARSSADLLLSVINDVLDFSKIEAGKLEVELLEFVVADVVEEAATALALRAEDKGLELTCGCDPRLPPLLRGDPARLRQVLINLIGNALKFTEHGEVVVRARVQDRAASPSVWPGLTGEAPALVGRIANPSHDLAEAEVRSPGHPGAIWVRFEVRDTGVGIPPEAQPRLFQAFAQADPSTTRKFGGTGLGLAICKHLVERMDGMIGVESEPGHGSLFWFVVRLEEAGPAVAGRPEAAGLSGVRILAVDDNATSRHVLQEQLAARGAACDTAADGPSALRRLCEAVDQERPYTLAIFDQHLPGMDGLQLARAVRADPALAGLRLVLLGSLGQPIDAGDRRQAGLDGYLSKPVWKASLLGVLREALQVRSSESGVRSQAEGPGGSPEGERGHPAGGLPTPESGVRTPDSGTPAGRILLVEDNLINAEVASTLLKRAGYACETVGNGQEAVEAVQRQRFDLILMDCQLPGMNGLEATHHIRAREEAGLFCRPDGRPVPIIALTATATRQNRDQCLEAGMDDYLSKPLDARQMLRLLAEHLGPAPGNQESSVPADRTANLAAALRRVLGNERLLARLAARFLEDSSGALASVRAAVEGGDATAVEQAAHRLKGQAATFDGHAVVRWAAELQQRGRTGDLAGADGLVAELATALQRLEEELRAYVRQQGLSPGD